MLEDDKREKLIKLRENILGCHKCSLRDHYDAPVPFVGHPNAPIMLIGEAPGADEVEQGKPFVGRAGQLLRKILTHSDYDIDKDIFIGNVLCCRPPNNKFPNDQTIISACEPWIESAIKIVDPAVVVALGGKPHRYIGCSKVGITRVAGTFEQWEERWYLPTIHPSFCLRPGHSNTSNEIMAMGQEEKQLLLAEHLRKAREKAMSLMGRDDDE